MDASVISINNKSENGIIYSEIVQIFCSSKEEETQTLFNSGHPSKKEMSSGL